MLTKKILFVLIMCLAFGCIKSTPKNSTKSGGDPLTGVNYTLTVTKAGGGVGTVTTSMQDFFCTTTCSQAYRENTVVTLLAQQNAGSTFAGWSGACSGTGSCVVTMNAAKSVTATFTVGSTSTNYGLTITKSGTGGGVVSSTTGINCGSTCSKSFSTNTSVTLSAVPNSTSTFAGWTGACTNTSGTCTVTMNTTRAVGAIFNTIVYPLSVTKLGAGTGTISSLPSGIYCGSTCAYSFTTGTSVTLGASPSSGSLFSGWSGGCTNTTGSCTVSMTAAKSVSATFSPIPATPTPVTSYALTITRNGSGNVTSTPAGISCGSNCSYSYNSGTSVTLSAAPSAGYNFSGWAGACANTTGTCTISMTGAKSVTANFSPIFSLTVNKNGTGSGVVTSAPSGINCGGTCSYSFNSGTAVTLSAVPSSGSTFSGWSGACSGTGTCVVAMSALKSVTASFANTTTGNQYYVSPTATTSGLGTLASPWTLNKALFNSNAAPGSTIFLRAGTYNNLYDSNLQGSATQTITVTSYPGERAVIDGQIRQAGGGYVTFKDLELKSSRTMRTSLINSEAPGDYIALDCFDVSAPGVKIINNVIHDCAGNGIRMTSGALNGEIYGNIIYNNGWDGPYAAYGKGIFVQNNTGVKNISNNIIFGNAGNYGIQAYGSSTTPVKNISFTGNTLFRGNFFVGAETPVSGITINNNYFYGDTGVFSIGNGEDYASTDNDDVQVSNNILSFISTNPYPNCYLFYWSDPTFQNNIVKDGNFYIVKHPISSTMNFSGNRYYGMQFILYSGWDGGQLEFPQWTTNLPDTGATSAASLTTGAEIALRVNSYNPTQANLTVFNWGKTDSVTISSAQLSSFLSVNDRYEIKDAQNYFGSTVLSGTYTGAAITLPMTSTSVAPYIGNFSGANSHVRAPVHTSKEFGVFIVKRNP